MAETPTHERRAHFRGKPRTGRRVELSYRRVDRPADEDGAAGGDGAAPGDDAQDDGAAPLVTAVTSNIGVGGAYILTDDPEPIGAVLEVALRVPTADQPIRVQAEVRWFIHPEKDPDGAGMGVKFLDIEVDALVQLSEYFASLTGAGAGDGAGGDE